MFTNLYPIKEQPDGTSVVRGGDVVPLAVREFGRIDAPADLLVSGNIDSEPETPEWALLADRQDPAIVSVLLAVDTLPSVSDFFRP